jgi:tetratricopeptide (TPR) repeat protein
MSNVEQQAGFLSNRYYNEALNRARIRDLSGAAEKLRISLQLNKKNIQALNLYGLVLYECGDIVEALHQWVLSFNLQPQGNLASTYVREIEKDSSRLNQMNRGIRDYNEALRNCREGNDDVGALRLRRALQKNPRLVKGYVLLALIDIKELRYNHARRMLNRALRIDKYNPDALRYQEEINEQTGNASAKGEVVTAEDDIPEENFRAHNTKGVGRRTIFRNGSYMSPAVNVIFGLVIGLLATCLLIVPSVRSSILNSNNNRTIELSSTIDSQQAKIDTLTSENESYAQQVSDAQDAQSTAETQAESMEYIFSAQQAYNDGDYQTALEDMANVDESVLSDAAKTAYDNLNTSLSSEAYDVYVQLGQEAYYNSDWETAAEYLEKAVEQDSSDSDSLTLLITCYQNLGDQEKELESWQRLATALAGTDEGTYAQTMADNLSEEIGESSSTDTSDTTDSTASDTTDSGTTDSTASDTTDSGTTDSTASDTTASDTTASGTTDTTNNE